MTPPVRPYVVVVDDPDLLRGHEMRIDACSDREAEHVAAVRAVARDWFDAGYGGARDGLYRVVERIEAEPEAYAKATGELWASAWPIDAAFMRPDALTTLDEEHGHKYGIEPTWRCFDCSHLNRSSDAFCWRCGAGQPERDSV